MELIKGNTTDEMRENDDGKAYYGSREREYLLYNHISRFIIILFVVIVNGYKIEEGLANVKAIKSSKPSQSLSNTQE